MLKQKCPILFGGWGSCLVGGFVVLVQQELQDGFASSNALVKAESVHRTALVEAGLESNTAQTGNAFDVVGYQLYQLGEAGGSGQFLDETGDIVQVGPVQVFTVFAIEMRHEVHSVFVCGGGMQTLRQSVASAALSEEMHQGAGIGRGEVHALI